MTHTKRIEPIHTDNTVYPFFWVSPVRKISLNPELANSGHYYEGCNWVDADAIYGVYRYDKPDETGISVATWIVDCDDLETADAITGAMNIVRDLQHFPLPHFGDTHENFKTARTLLV